MLFFSVGRGFFFLFVPLLLPDPWADLHQTWWEGLGRPRIFGHFFSFPLCMSYLRLCACVYLICLHRRNHLTATSRRVKFSSTPNNKW